MEKSERQWFDDRIVLMFSRHGKTLTESELLGYWDALKSVPCDVVKQVTADTTQRYDWPPRAYVLSEDAKAVTSRRDGFGHRDFDCDEEPTPEQKKRVRAIVQAVLDGTEIPGDAEEDDATAS